MKSILAFAMSLICASAWASPEASPVLSFAQVDQLVQSGMILPKDIFEVSNADFEANQVADVSMLPAAILICTGAVGCFLSGLGIKIINDALKKDRKDPK